MNTKFFTSALIAIASLTSVSAFAAGADNAPEQKSTFTSTQSRAEVRAGALMIKKGPVTSSGQVDGGMASRTVATGIERSRADVSAQAAKENSTSYNPAPGRA